MQSPKFRPILGLRSVSKNCIRLVTVTAEKVGVNDTVPLKSWREIPGPTSLPIIGLIHHFFPGGMFHSLDFLALTNKLYENYGPIVRLDAFVGKDPVLFLFDAESFSQIHRGENSLPIRPGFQSLEYYRKKFKKGVKKGRPVGLITDKDELWKELRYTANPLLLQPKTIKFYTRAIDEVAMDMIERIKFQRDENFVFNGNFYEAINLWSLETIGVVVFGSRLGGLDPNLKDDSPIKKLLKCTHDLLIMVDKLDFMPSIWKMVSTPNFKKAMALYALQESLSGHFIQKAMQEFKMKNKSDDEKGVLEKLLAINEDFAHIMANDMLLIGVDAVANTLTGILYWLAVNPEKQNKLREELRSNDEKKPYLKASLKEALRMIPILSGNVRVTTKEYSMLGYKIPPNMQVFCPHHYLSMSEEHFPRSKEFLPERWLVDKDDPLHYKHAHPFVYSPFGFGVRSCIGRRISELEMETFTARLVENFQIEWFGPQVEVKHSTVNIINGPFNFIFKDVAK